jgi:hypothetical protein
MKFNPNIGLVGKSQILLHLTFHIDLNWNEMDTSSKILLEYHFYISDDKSHHNLFVQHWFKLHLEFLGLQSFILLIEHIVFLDNCASQFKCAKSLFCVVQYPSLTKREELPMRCAMQWDHFGSNHGKGRWDGARGHVKQALRAEQI